MSEFAWAVTTKVGSGTFACVYRVDAGEGFPPLAMKAVSRDAHKAMVRRSSSRLRVEDEYDILSTVAHPHILRVHGTHGSDTCFNIITDFLCGSSLFDAVVTGGALDVGCFYNLYQAMTGACSYLHAHDIMHRDIKPENIMSASHNPSPTWMLLDFGLARRGTKMP